MTARATDFVRYHVATVIVAQLDRWPNETTGASPIIMRWFSGRVLLACIRVRPPIAPTGTPPHRRRDAKVQVTFRGRIRQFKHSDVLQETPEWLSMLKELKEALTTRDA